MVHLNPVATGLSLGMMFFVQTPAIVPPNALGSSDRVAIFIGGAAFAAYWLVQLWKTVGSGSKNTGNGNGNAVAAAHFQGAAETLLKTMVSLQADTRDGVRDIATGITSLTDDIGSRDRCIDELLSAQRGVEIGLRDLTNEVKKLLTQMEVSADKQRMS